MAMKKIQWDLQDVNLQLQRVNSTQKHIPTELYNPWIHLLDKAPT